MNDQISSEEDGYCELRLRIEDCSSINTCRKCWHWIKFNEEESCPKEK